MPTKCRCSFCNKTKEEVDELLESDDGAICSGCLQAAQKSKRRCNFCDKSKEESGELIEGQNGFICFSCVETAKGVMASAQGKQRTAFTLEKMPTPLDIYESLNQYVVGQDSAKRTMSVAVVNHYKRLIAETITGIPDQYAEVEIDKSNILLLGPTGSGKTLIAQTLAKKLNVPFAIGDATSLTAAGYVGDDVEVLLQKLLMACEFDVAAAERGIIYIDEIDKIAASHGNVSITRDVGGECVQQGLLKLIEGTEASVPPAGGRKHPEQQCISVNTKNILFICGGAFVGLDEIILRRLGKRRIGFFGERESNTHHSVSKDILSHITPEDLQEFGFIPELIGRLPVITHVEHLDEDTLVRILTEPKNAIVRQYKKLFNMDGVKLEFTDEALKVIAHKAIARKTGARALRAVVEEVMTPIMFDLHKVKKGEQFVVGADTVNRLVRGKAA